jgi:hypothetical protein
MIQDTFREFFTLSEMKSKQKENCKRKETIKYQEVHYHGKVFTEPLPSNNKGKTHKTD